LCLFPYGRERESQFGSYRGGFLYRWGRVSTGICQQLLLCGFRSRLCGAIDLLQWVVDTPCPKFCYNQQNCSTLAWAGWQYLLSDLYFGDQPRGWDTSHPLCYVS